MSEAGLVTRLSGQQEALGLVVRAWWSVCAHPGPFSHSSFRRDCSPLEPGATRGQGSFCSSQGWLTCVAQDLTFLTDGMFLSLLVMSHACHSQGLALCQPTLPPCCGSGWLFPPTVHWGRSTWVLSLGKNLGLLVLGKGCKGKRDRCVGLEGASQGLR